MQLYFVLLKKNNSIKCPHIVLSRWGLAGSSMGTEPPVNLLDVEPQAPCISRELKPRGTSGEFRLGGDPELSNWGAAYRCVRPIRTCLIGGVALPSETCSDWPDTHMNEWKRLTLIALIHKKIYSLFNQKAHCNFKTLKTLKL